MTEIEKQIEDIIEKEIDPILDRHFGKARLSKLSDGVAYIKLEGACSSCPSAQFTLEDIVKTAILEKVPELEDVRLDDSVSEDLLDMARKILKG